MKACKWALGVSMLGLLLLVMTGCSDSLSRSYYARHPMSSEEVSRVWGAPVAVIPMDEGIEKRIYAIQNPATDLKYRYFLVKEGQVFASGITDQTSLPATPAPEEKTSFVPSDLSKLYYQKVAVSAADLDRVWGQPLHIDAVDGMQRRVYEISDPMTDFRYRYFLIKDGRVFASRISTERGFKDPVGSRTQKGIQIGESSKSYYDKHPMTLDAVEKVWGQPVAVEKGDGGLEKRIYKIVNPYPSAFEFRYFIVRNGNVVSSGITDTVDVAR